MIMMDELDKRRRQSEDDWSALTDVLSHGDKLNPFPYLPSRWSLESRLNRALKITFNWLSEAFRILRNAAANHLVWVARKLRREEDRKQINKSRRAALECEIESL